MRGLGNCLRQNSPLFVVFPAPHPPSQLRCATPLPLTRRRGGGLAWFVGARASRVAVSARFRYSFRRASVPSFTSLYAQNALRLATTAGACLCLSLGMVYPPAPIKGSVALWKNLQEL